MAQKQKIAILGASGYTGSELLRLLLAHPQAEIIALTAEKNAGQPASAVLPHLRHHALPDLCKIGAVDFSQIDIVFCALPHGTTQEVIAALPATVKVIDLSADFRLQDLAAYEEWYGHAHRAPHLQPSAVYGLCEIMRDHIRTARIIANPGCYPTAAQLPLIPLLRAQQISPDDIIIDAKSGVSGAGRELKQGNLYCEVADGMQAYAVAGHRHAPEIEAGLSTAAGQPILVNFTPHLVPMHRGIFASIYVRMNHGVTIADLRTTLQQAYAIEPFIQLLPEGTLPSSRYVRGTNLCQMAVIADRIKGRAIILSTIDNLVKGAAGQAVQNMNILCDLPENTGLEHTALFP